MSQTKRQKTKYSALDPKYNLKTRFEQIDIDYADELPEKWLDPATGKTINPKEWMNNFVEEYVHTDFRGKRVTKKKKAPHPKNEALLNAQQYVLDILDGLLEYINKKSGLSTKSRIKIKKPIHKLKISIKKNIKGQLKFYKDFYKSDAENRNNSRNRCMYTRARAQGKTMSTDELKEDYDSYDVEDNIIDRIDGLKFANESEDSGDQS